MSMMSFSTRGPRRPDPSEVRWEILARSSQGGVRDALSGVLRGAELQEAAAAMHDALRGAGYETSLESVEAALRELGAALRTPAPDPEPPEPETSEEPEEEPEISEELGADVVDLDSRRPTPPEPVEEPEPEEGEEGPAGVVLDGGIAAAVEADEDHAREGLREMLEADRLPGFYDQSRLGLIRLTTTAREYQRLLEERGVQTTVDAIEAVFPELAREYAPGSAAAAWERLLESLRTGRAADSRKMKTGYAESVGAIKSLATVDPEHYKLLTRLALYEPDQDSLVAAARTIYVELRRRRIKHEPKHFSDFIWQAVHDVLPGYPGAVWHESWSARIRGELMRRVHERVGDSTAEVPGLSEGLQEMAEAEERGDRRSYRDAARRAYRTVHKM